MKEKRVSNKLKQKQLQTKYLEEQTKKMQDKLGELKRQIEEQKKLRSELGLDSTITRWQKAAKTNAPLKSYAKQVLEEQKQAYAQFGISQKKVTGTKAFEGVLKQMKKEQELEQERNPTKIATFLKPAEETDLIAKQTVLENNFFKAKMDVKALIKQKTLEEFLEENFILEYLPSFSEAGITDLETLRYVTRERLGELGVKAGHQVKIIKKIKEEFDKMLNGKKEEPVQLPQQTTQKVESGYGEGDVNSYNNEPIDNLPPDSTIVENNNSQNYYTEEDAQEEQQERDQVLITAPMREMSLQADEQSPVNCYECYRPILYPEFHYDERYFCCETCMGKYLNLLKKCCPTCGVTFLKTEGYREAGVWFCSLGCCPNHQEIEQLFFQWHQGTQ